MTNKLSYNAEMARRLLAMTISLPINSDPGLREDTFWLGGIADILRAANCYTEVEREMREKDVLNKGCHPMPKECVEALHWVLEKTGDPIRFLHMLAGEYTLYFLQDDDYSIGLFADKHVAFFKDFVRKRSKQKQLELAGEAVRLAERSSNARMDWLHFASEVLQGIKYELNCAAFHRRNLIVGSLEMIASDTRQYIKADLRNVSIKDVSFGIADMIRLNTNG